MKRQPVVLIVDDAKDNREGYAQYLQFRGVSTREAATGGEARKHAPRAQPDAKHHGPADEQEREEEFRVRVRDLADPGGTAFGRHRGLQHDPDHEDHDGRGDPERDRLLKGDQEQLHARMLADCPGPEGALVGTMG